MSVHIIPFLFDKYQKTWYDKPQREEITNKKHMKRHIVRMAKSPKHRSVFYVFIGVIAAVGILRYQFNTQAASDGTVTGRIVQPNGTTAVSGVSVSIHTSNWYNYQYQTTGSDGTFSFSNVPAGSYKLDMYYYSTSYFTPDSVSFTVTENQTADLGAVLLLAPNVFGKITAPDGVTGLANASVSIHNADWSISKYAPTTETGAFQLALSSNGTYTVEAYTYGTDYSRPDPLSITYAGSALYLDGTNGSSVISAINPAMRGKVVLTDGTSPAQYASLSLYDANNMGLQWASTDSNGNFKIDAVASGTYTLRVNPPYSPPGLVGPDPILVTLTKGTVNTAYQTTPIQLSAAQKTISGTIKRAKTGAAVTSGNVYAWQYYGGGYANTTIDTNGQYSLLLGSGEWFLSVYPSWNGSSPDWTYVGSPKKVSFTKSNSVVESATVDYEVLSYTATLKGQVLLPNGSAPPTADYVSVSVWSNGGAGNWAQVDSAGNFSMKLPPGNYNVSPYGSSTQYGSPSMSAVTLADDQTLNLGTVKMLAKDATISGSVRNDKGQGLANQYVNAWPESNGNGWGWATTDSNGNFTVNVTPGRWCVNSYPSYTGDIAYVATNQPACVSATAQQTTSGVNFVFDTADATISGKIVDPDVQALTSIYGWLQARKSGTTTANGFYYNSLGASISGGTFTLKVPGGTWDICASLGYGSQYSAGDCQAVTVASGGVKNDVTIAMVPNNVTVTGSFKDEQGKVLTDIFGSVSAQRVNGNSYLWSSITNGTYTMKAAAGTWKLGCWVDQATSSQYYLAGTCDREITAAADTTVTQDITLKVADSSLEITAVDANDQPVANAFVSVDTSYGKAKSVSYDMYGAWFNRSNYTDQNGKLKLKVPAGTYFVSATLPPDLGFSNPKHSVVTVSADEPGNPVLKFTKPDATIVGAVTLNSSPVDGAFVSASSNNGGYAETTTQNGAYTLSVAGGETWSVIAADEISATNAGYREGTAVDVAVGEKVTAPTIALGDGQHEDRLTVPTAASTTTATNNQLTVSLSDGATVIAPANTFSLQNSTVTVTVTATVDVPETATAQPANGMGYDLEVRQQSGQNAGQEVTSFSADATVCLPYDEVELTADGLSPTDLAAQYWDEAAGTYRDVNTSTVDTVGQRVCLTTDHFTKFVITAAPVVKTSVTPGVSQPGGTTEAPLVSPEVTVLSTKQIAFVANNPNGGPTVWLYQANGKLAKTFKPFGRAAQGKFMLASGDLNGDAVDELVVWDTSGRQHQANVFRLNGKKVGTIQLPSIGRPSLVVTDLNNDRRAEIITASSKYSTATVSGYRGKKFGSLTTVNRPFGPGGMTIASANLAGDNGQELLIMNTAGSPRLMVYSVNPLKRTARVVAQADATLPLALGMNIKAANVAGDAHDELVIQSERTISVATVTKSSVTPLDKLTLSSRSEVVVGDVNGDRRMDLVATSLTSNSVQAFSYSRADKKLVSLGSFTPFSARSAGTPAVGDLVIGDVDVNGQPDILVSQYRGGKVASYQYREKKFKLVGSYSVTTASSPGFRLLIPDLNGDGYREVVTVPNQGASRISILRYKKNVFSLSRRLTVGGKDFTGLINVTAAANR